MRSAWASVPRPRAIGILALAATSLFGGSWPATAGSASQIADRATIRYATFYGPVCFKSGNCRQVPVRSRLTVRRAAHDAPDQQVRTGPDGRGASLDLLPGTYEIIPLPRNDMPFSTPKRTVEVTAGETVDVIIDFYSGQT